MDFLLVIIEAKRAKGLDLDAIADEFVLFCSSADELYVQKQSRSSQDGQHEIKQRDNTTVL